MHVSIRSSVACVHFQPHFLLSANRHLMVSSCHVDSFRPCHALMCLPRLQLCHFLGQESLALPRHSLGPKSSITTSVEVSLAHLSMVDHALFHLCFHSAFCFCCTYLTVSLLLQRVSISSTGRTVISKTKRYLRFFF